MAATRKGAAKGGKSAPKAAAQKRKGAAPPRGAAKAKGKPSAAARKRELGRKRRAEAKEAKRIAGELELAKDGLTGAAKTVENAQLYVQVFAGWARGEDYASLAVTHGLGIRRCQQIVSELRDTRLEVLRLNDPLFGVRTAHDMVLHWTAAISEYAQLARDTKNESVKLGALRDRDRALESYASLLQELGWLPKNLGTLRVVQDSIEMAAGMLDVLEAHDAPEALVRALMEAMELRVERSRGKLALQLGSGDVDSTAEVVRDGVAA